MTNLRHVDQHKLLPGFFLQRVSRGSIGAGLFPDGDLWGHEIGLSVLQFIAERGGTHRVLLDAGIVFLVFDAAPSYHLARVSSDSRAVE